MTGLSARRIALYTTVTLVGLPLGALLLLVAAGISVF